MSDLHKLSAAEQLRALRAGEVSSRELTEHYLDRIARLDTRFGAFATVTPELALEEAARADQRLARGESAPLLGLPMGVKDLFAAGGVRTTFGSAALAGFVPQQDAWTVGLLRRAGAVLTGKTSAAEIGLTCFTDHAAGGQPTVTPYDPARYSSGSSGGAAAAVAAGLLPVAHASDGAGSTRTPAATCHLIGVKPSRGLVTSSVPPSSLSSVTIEGPIARTVEDAAVVLDVMAQPWVGDLDAWRPDTSFADRIKQPPGRALRVAAWTGTGLAGLDPHPQAAHAVQRTTTLLRELGHEVQDVAVPAVCDEPVRNALVTWFAAAVGSAVPSMVPPARQDLLLPYTRYLLHKSRALSASDILAAHAVLAGYASAFLAELDGFDLALTPTTSGPPAPVGHFLTDGVAGVADLMLAWSCYTPWANFTGQPAVSLPSHLDSDGLPYAVQLVGRRNHDAGLLAVAAQLERAGLWEDVHPPCWNQ